MICCRCVSRSSILVGVLLGLWIGFGGQPAHAQLGEPDGAPYEDDGPNVGVSLTLRGHTLPSERGSAERRAGDSPRIGRALLGSTIGVGAGVGIGLLLLKGAAEGSPDEEVDNRRERQASDAAATMTLIGVAAMAAGGPIGAVRGAGIERNRRAAYIGAGFGELVGGLLGYALAGQLHDSTPSRLVGLGAGMAAGSAAGAVWVASAQGGKKGLLRYRKGRWRVSTPDVRVRPGLATGRKPSVGVTVVSAAF